MTEAPGQAQPEQPQDLDQIVEEALESGVEGVGTGIIGLIEDIGGMVEMASGAALAAVRPPYRVANLLEQVDFVGVGSIFVVGITGLFTGMVFAVQSYNAFSLFNAQSLVGSTVALALARELAPVFAGLMVAARVGSSMATELGSMRVSEQIDALVTLAIDPIQYLVVPRLVAATVMMPFLTILFDGLGILGAYFVAVVTEHLSPGLFLGRIHLWVDPEDVISGLIKSAVFGLIIALVACYKGFNTTGGSKGVGRATNQAVVTGSVAVLVIDYFLSLALMGYVSKS
jgi:phospholipid/cholesterol/gamma-HCH transport system permease protein